MFLDDAEQVFILVFDVWMRFRQNREKIQRVLILVTTFAYEFNLSRLIRQGFRELRQRHLGEPVRNDRNAW